MQEDLIREIAIEISELKSEFDSRISALHRKLKIQSSRSRSGKGLQGKTRFGKILFLILLVSFLTPQTSSAENLIIIGWDGAGLNNVQPLLDAGQLPNLQAFLLSGAKMVPVDITGFTCTVPSWTELFTGLTPDQTGVMGNRPPGKINPSGFPLYIDGIYGKLGFWIKPVPDEWTLQAKFRSMGYSTGNVTSKHYLGGPRQPMTKTFKRCDTNKVFEPQRYSDGYIDLITESAVDFVQSHADTDYFLFAHYDPDYYGHQTNENDPRYLAEFVRSDAELGKLLAVIDRSDTQIIVMCDHGFDEGGHWHKNAPDGWMATTLPIRTDYRVILRDLYPTIAEYFGLPGDGMQRRGRSFLAHETRWSVD
jgi:arylsulfatase A-like enzyme